MTDLFRWHGGGDHYAAHFPLVGSVQHLRFRAPAQSPPGYLHLFEHLLLRASQPQLEAAEARGCTYNATTTPEGVSFYFTSPDAEPAIDVDALTAVPFEEQHLARERETIRQERLVHAGAPEQADAMLGSLAAIDAFDLTCLAALRAGLAGRFDTVLYSDHDAPGGPASAPGATASEQPEGALDPFFLRIVAQAAPEPAAWPTFADGVRQLLPEQAAYVRRHKRALLFRYRLSLQTFAHFDREFRAYLTLARGRRNLATTFLETPWESTLTCASSSASASPSTWSSGCS